jgi:hypothetical protein
LYKGYPSSEEVVVPWNARYSFPSQANKAVKITPRIPPKNGATFTPGQVIRLEFPAQGYVNPINTTLSFDVTLTGPVTTASVAPNATRFQNNIQSIFSRVRLMYGSTPLEDIINYNQIVRNLTEWTATNQNNTLDQMTITDGVGGYTVSTDTASGTNVTGLVNVRQKFIQGINTINNASPFAAPAFGLVPLNSANGTGLSSTSSTTRRYQVNLALGLMTQDKLIPVKFMASQLAIEITLEQAVSCIYCDVEPSGGNPTYAVSNINLIPEILEFDASYGKLFFQVINLF